MSPSAGHSLETLYLILMYPPVPKLEPLAGSCRLLFSCPNTVTVSFGYGVSL
ncbi:Uncharacterised protein [uncultured archaeon]|nr:Uncharacterised protein [uncultured archaeon]